MRQNWKRPNCPVQSASLRGLKPPHLLNIEHRPIPATHPRRGSLNKTPAGLAIGLPPVGLQL